MTVVIDSPYPNGLTTISIITLPLPKDRLVYIGRENGQAARKTLNLDALDIEIQEGPYDREFELVLDQRSLGFYTSSFLIGLFAGSYETLGATRFLQSYRLMYSEGDYPLKPHPEWKTNALNLTIRLDRERQCK